MTMKSVVGQYVEGPNFYGREEDLRLFTSCIREGAHVSLLAQRRMGKTSLMHEAARQLKEEYLCLYVDLEAESDAPGIIAKLSQEAYGHRPIGQRITKALLGNLGKLRKGIGQVDLFGLKVQFRDSLDSGNWMPKGDEVLTALASCGKPVLLLLDEVPIAVNRMLKGQNHTITEERRREVDAFMSWLRRNALRHQGTIRVVVTGSIGLAPILRQVRLNTTLNTFRPFELRPWTAAIAAGCIRELAKHYSIRFPDGAEEEMAERLGCCIPGHVQIFFSHVRDYYVRENLQQFLRKDVAHIYKDEMLATHGHVEAMHYEERLRSVLGPELTPLANEILTEAALVGRLNQGALTVLEQGWTLTSRTPREAHNEILDVLQHDGYLKNVDGEYVWESYWIRDWWKKTYGADHVPVAKRKRNT